MPALQDRAGWLATAVLGVLTAGVVSSVALQTPSTALAVVLTAPPAVAPDPTAATPTPPTPTSPTPDVLVFPATVLPPVPVDPFVAASPTAAPSPPAAASAPAPPASADPLCSGQGWQQRRGEAALASLRRPADAQAFTVAFRPARTDVMGLAHLQEGRVELFVRSCRAQSAELLRHVLAHELGHLLDVERMTAALRSDYLAARDIPADAPWYGCDGCTDFGTPAGDFAEAYSQWQRGAPSNRSTMGAPMSSAELEQIAARFFP